MDAQIESLSVVQSRSSDRQSGKPTVKPHITHTREHSAGLLTPWTRTEGIFGEPWSEYIVDMI